MIYIYINVELYGITNTVYTYINILYTIAKNGGFHHFTGYVRIFIYYNMIFREIHKQSPSYGSEHEASASSGMVLEVQGLT